MASVQKITTDHDEILTLEGHEIVVKHQFAKPKQSAKQVIMNKLSNLLNAPVHEGFHYEAVDISVTKYAQDTEDKVARLSALGTDIRTIYNKTGLAPYEINKHYALPIAPLNIMLNEGIAQVWDLIIGADLTNLYNAANARVGVGNGTAATNATHTGLQGGSTAFIGMDATFPSRANQTVSFKGTFNGSSANFAWEEFTVDNGNTSNKNLNRAVVSKGTKVNGEVWSVQVDITGS